MLVTSPAKYANHACEPNSRINDNLEIETVCPVKKGQEFNFFYNEGTAEEIWDDAWTFQCQCGSDICQGMVDRYRPRPMRQ